MIATPVPTKALIATQVPTIIAKTMALLITPVTRIAAKTTPVQKTVMMSFLERVS
jgi:hypothetical protein